MAKETIEEHQMRIYREASARQTHETKRHTADFSPAGFDQLVKAISNHNSRQPLGKQLSRAWNESGCDFTNVRFQQEHSRIVTVWRKSGERKQK